MKTAPLRQCRQTAQKRKKEGLRTPPSISNEKTGLSTLGVSYSASIAHLFLPLQLTGGGDCVFWQNSFLRIPGYRQARASYEFITGPNNNEPR